MITGAEGYRKEDGYTWKNLAANTITSGIGGAGSAYLFDKAGSVIKIPGINKGRGSFQASWKQVMTKAANGQIKNIALKTVGKGIVAYGAVHLIDETIQKGWKKAKDTVKEKGTEMITNWLTSTLGGNPQSARCPAEG